MVVLDDLLTGQADPPPGVPLVAGSVPDGDLVAERCARTRGVHVAAEKQVKESVRLPLLSHRDGVERLRVLLEQPIEAGVASLGSCSSGQASVHLLGADSVIEGDGGTTCLIPPGGSPSAIRPGG